MLPNDTVWGQLCQIVVPDVLYIFALVTYFLCIKSEWHTVLLLGKVSNERATEVATAV